MTIARLHLKEKPTPTEAELQRHAVARLVANVRDEQHWQQILASAGEAERAELERVVAPMLPWRTAAKCTTPDCASGKPGIWQPCLEVRGPDMLSYVPIELHLCDDCKAEAQLADFLTDTIWTQVMLAWTNGSPPLRRLTTLAWDRVH